MKLRVWHIPQIPMESFYVAVPDVETAKLVLELLARYDIFQYEHRVKPDYSNASGLQYWDATEEEWCDWVSDDGMNIDEVMADENYELEDVN